MAGSTPTPKEESNGMGIMAMIQLAAALFKVVAEGNIALGKIKAQMAKATEMTPEERAAWTKVMEADHAKPAWQANEDVPT